MLARSGGVASIVAASPGQGCEGSAGRRPPDGQRQPAAAAVPMRIVASVIRSMFTANARTGVIAPRRSSYRAATPARSEIGGGFRPASPGQGGRPAATLPVEQTRRPHARRRSPTVRRGPSRPPRRSRGRTSPQRRGAAPHPAAARRRPQVLPGKAPTRGGRPPPPDSATVVDARGPARRGPPGPRESHPSPGMLRRGGIALGGTSWCGKRSAAWHAVACSQERRADSGRAVADRLIGGERAAGAASAALSSETASSRCRAAGPSSRGAVLHGCGGKEGAGTAVPGGCSACIRPNFPATNCSRTACWS